MRLYSRNFGFTQKSEKSRSHVLVLFLILVYNKMFFSFFGKELVTKGFLL